MPPFLRSSLECPQNLTFFSLFAFLLNRPRIDRKTWHPQNFVFHKMHSEYQVLLLLCGSPPRPESNPGVRAAQTSHPLVGLHRSRYRTC